MDLKNIQNWDNSGRWTNVLVPLSQYDITKDPRFLIPFFHNDMNRNRVGLFNREGIVVVRPFYDQIVDACYSPDDLIRVCVQYIHNYGSEIRPRIYYYYYYYGLIDAQGKELIEPKHKMILVSPDKQYITLQNEKGYALLNRDLDEIIPFGIFDCIDGCTSGYVRVQKDNKWGIADTNGKIVLPIEYDSIDEFYKKSQLKSVRVRKDGNDNRFYFSTGSLNGPDPYIRQDKYNPIRHYEEFAGTYAQDYAGFSDEDIYDAFEGDPDAYWNID